MKNFDVWLLNVLQERKISQAELARLAGISKGTISNLIHGTAGVGPDSLSAISHALKLPPEIVFRAAGILPPERASEEIIEEIIHLTSDLPESERNEVLAYVRMRKERLENKEVNVQARKKQTKPA
jgi:transcriptional regulator with XRE-family HTH domain